MLNRQTIRRFTHMAGLLACMLTQFLPVELLAQEVWTGRSRAANSKGYHLPAPSVPAATTVWPPNGRSASSTLRSPTSNSQWRSDADSQRSSADQFAPPLSRSRSTSQLDSTDFQGTVQQTAYQTPKTPRPLIPPSPDWSPTDAGQVRSGNTQGIQFNFRSTPWELVLRKLAEENGLSLQIQELPPGDFTYFDQRVYSLTEALDLVNDSLLADGYLAIQSGRNLVVINTTQGIPENLIPLVQPEDLGNIGRTALASVAIPILEGVPASAAQEIEQILSPIGTVAPLTTSRRLLVTDTGGNLRRVHQLLTGGITNPANLPSFIYQLRNTQAVEVALAINDFLAGTTTSADGSSSPDRRVSAPGFFNAQVVPEPTTNRLLVKGRPEELEKIRQLIEEIDRSPPQVVIQALLVEVELGNTDEFGVEIGVQDSVLFDRSVIDDILTISRTFTNPNGNQTTDQQVISQTAQPGFNFNNQPLGNNVAVNPSSIGSQGLSNLGVGRTNGDLGYGGLVLSASSESVSILLRALAENHHVDVLSRPQVRVLDNHEALIQIGRQVPVVDGVAITAVGSANPVIRQDQSGIILTVTPRISPDGLVTINVNAEKSAFQLGPGSGVPIFTDATNGNVIEAPVKDITSTQTSVSVNTGETIVLGGMITRDSVVVDRKVPWLGDLPYVGGVFRYDFDQMTRKELLIFLTPHVINHPTQSELLKRAEISRMSLPLAEAEMLHGPILGQGHLDSPGPGNFPTHGEWSPSPSDPINAYPLPQPPTHQPIVPQTNGSTYSVIEPAAYSSSSDFNRGPADADSRHATYTNPSSEVWSAEANAFPVTMPHTHPYSTPQLQQAVPRHQPPKKPSFFERLIPGRLRRR